MKKYNVYYKITSSKKISYLIILCFILFLSVLGGKIHGEVNPNVSNDNIANIATSYDGQWKGQCKIFAQTVMGEAGGYLGPGYRQCFLDAGIEISEGEAQRGDFIQLCRDSDPETFWKNAYGYRN